MKSQRNTSYISSLYKVGDGSHDTFFFPMTLLTCLLLTLQPQRSGSQEAAATQALMLFSEQNKLLSASATSQLLISSAWNIPSPNSRTAGLRSFAQIPPKPFLTSSLVAALCPPLCSV